MHIDKDTPLAEHWTVFSLRWCEDNRRVKISTNKHNDEINVWWHKQLFFFFFLSPIVITCSIWRNTHNKKKKKKISRWCLLNQHHWATRRPPVNVRHRMETMGLRRPISFQLPRWSRPLLNRSTFEQQRVSGVALLSSSSKWSSLRCGNWWALDCEPWPLPYSSSDQ